MINEIERPNSKSWEVVLESKQKLIVSSELHEEGKVERDGIEKRNRSEVPEGEVERYLQHKSQCGMRSGSRERCVGNKHTKLEENTQNRFVPLSKEAQVNSKKETNKGLSVQATNMVKVFQNKV